MVLPGVILEPDIHQHTVDRVETKPPIYVTNPHTFSPIKYLGSDRITIGSVHRLCKVSCSLTSRCQICDRTNIRRSMVKYHHMWRGLCGIPIATQQWFVRSQISQRELTERPKLHSLRTDHGIIWSELIYLIGAKNVPLKSQDLHGKTDQFPMVRGTRVVGPIATVRVQEEPYPEPTWECGPVADSPLCCCCEPIGSTHLWSLSWFIDLSG
jgi:hypothetical protein